MIRLLFAALTILIFTGCSTSQSGQTNTTTANTLSAKEKSEGWKLLFDGTTKNGWHVYNNKSDGAAWKVANGTLYLDPKAKGPRGEGGGDIASDEAFENFHLKLEWKLDSAGNSGIIFQAQEDPKYRWGWVTGPEMQMIDNNAHPDAKNPKHRAGDLYDLIAATEETAKPIGQWNELEIMQNNGQLDLFMNGKKIVSTTQWDENWFKLIANSKFKSMQDFGKFRNGKIVLQDHGDPVWFRNIKVKLL